MPSRAVPEATGPEPDRSLHARVLAPLSRRIAAGRADTSLQRDPDFIRRQLPAIARYTSYFTPEVRGLDRLPAEGPVLLVGNHSCLFYMPEVWTCGQAIMSRRGIGAPAYLLAYDLLFAMPGIGPFLRQLGAVPASTDEAESALARGACVLVYPGGDLEACRPWTQRNKVDFAGRKGFVRLALRCGVPDSTRGRPWRPSRCRGAGARRPSSPGRRPAQAADQRLPHPGRFPVRRHLRPDAAAADAGPPHPRVLACARLDGLRSRRGGRHAHRLGLL